MSKQFCPYCMTPVAPGESCPTCGLTAGNYTPSPHHLPPGTVLMDRYLVGRVLGEGGFGITYIGCDLKLELKVAIKEYFPSDKVTRHAQASPMVTNYTGLASASFDSGKAKFLNEARTMARMDKLPNIVSVRDFFEENNTAYIVMEYVEGTTFKELVAQKGGRIPAGELLHLIEPLFSALTTMHAMGLIHRDISPDNLMLENGMVRLIDFGCARESAHGTETMTVALKHGYAPIEQYQHKGQGPWTDVYALSATIYYCLTGKAPPQSLDRLCEDELILPRKLGVDLTEKQEKALLYGMGIRPKRRFQSIQELHTALYEGEDFTARPEPSDPDAPIFDPTPEPPKPEQPEPAPVIKTEVSEPISQPENPRRNWKLWVGVGVAAVLLVVLLAVLLPRGDGPGPDPSPSQSELVEDGPFAGAARLSLENETVFRAMLENDDFPAIIVPAGCNVSLTKELEITKPVLVEEGGSIFSVMPLTISGNGLLRLEGGYGNDGCITITTGGGRIEVASTGSLELIGGLWMEHENDLTVENGGSAIAGGVSYDTGGNAATRFITVDEDALFANAIHVTTLEEYDQYRYGSTPIVIDADLTITNDHRNHTVPVLISEGVTITAPVAPGAEPDVSNDYCAWDVDGTILVNHGTILGTIISGDWNDDDTTDYCTIINYGTIAGSVHLDCPGAFVNSGEMVVSNSQIYEPCFYNLGTLTHSTDQADAEYDFLDIFAPFYNCGKFVEAGSSNDSYTTLTQSAFWNYGGLIRVAGGGELNVETTIAVCGGELQVEAGGRLNNMGYIYCDGASVFSLDPDSTLGYTGLFQFSEDIPVNFPSNVQDGGGSTIYFSWDTTPRYQVSSEELLRRCLETGVTSSVLSIDGADLTVEGDLTLDRSLAIAGNFLYLIDGNLTVTGQDTFLCGGVIDLGGGTLTLTDGAVLVGAQVINCGGITIEDGAKMVSTGPLDLLPGTMTDHVQLTLNNAGHLINLADTELSQADIQIGQYCVLRTCAPLDILNSEMSLVDGEFLMNNADVHLYNSGIYINEGGKLSATANTDRRVLYLNSSVDNYGLVELGMDTHIVDKQFTNYGTIDFWSDITLTGNTGGALTNRGTMLSRSGAQVQIDKGSFTGDPMEIYSAPDPSGQPTTTPTRT